MLTGARQTGKTTLLKKIFPDHHYVSLDLPSQAEEAKFDPETFLRKNSAPLIIDEVQYAPELFRHLVSDSLAGRVGLLELEGLEAAEIGSPLQDYLKIQGPAKTLARGFFPQLWRELDFPSFEYYQSYIATYLERDVRQILNVNSLRDFERFMRACAIRSGHILNKSELAKDVGIHHKTAQDWLSVLQASNQILILEPYFSNETKRMVKLPKLYFADTGLLCALLSLRESNIDTYAHLGPIWETYLYGELRKHRSNLRLRYSTWFYRDQQGLELDFLVESAGQLHLLEAKWNQQPDRKAMLAMNLVQERLRQVKTKTILCRAELPHGGCTSCEWVY